MVRAAISNILYAENTVSFIKINKATNSGAPHLRVNEVSFF